jgi:hypothetical protein
MARPNLATNAKRHGQSWSDRQEDDDWGSSYGGRDWREHGRSDSHGMQEWHGSHESCDRGHDGRHRRDEDRDEWGIDMDKQSEIDIEVDDDSKRNEIDIEVDVESEGDEIDIEVGVESEGKWLEVAIEIGSHDIDLKLDGRHLQPDTTPVVAMLGGEGTAVGEETLVDAEIFSRLLDFGTVTIAFGTAEFTSVAGSGEDAAFAAATTFADVSGADLVFVFNKTGSTSSDCDSSYAAEFSETSFIAIDFERFDFAEGQLTFNFDATLSYLVGCGQCGNGRIPDIDGNVALLDVDALAQAQSTFVDVLSSILTVEGQLSSVSAVTVSGVA